MPPFCLLLNLLVLSHKQVDLVHPLLFLGKPPKMHVFIGGQFLTPSYTRYVVINNLRWQRLDAVDARI